jgi:hypothetical protein
MFSRINPGERQKIIVENFLTFPASRGNKLSVLKYNSTEKNVSTKPTKKAPFTLSRVKDACVV